MLNQKYGSDKLDGYLEIYKPILDSFPTNIGLHLLELGVDRGGSLRFWKDYMPEAIITGVDSDITRVINRDDSIHLYQGDQTDVAFLSQCAAMTAPDGWDIIIDDASHIGLATKISFWHLFENHLKPGGYYFIEDWGTGYWDNSPDGGLCDLDAYRRDMESMESHTCGMVGFVKQLVDETAASDVTRRRVSGVPSRGSKIQQMKICPGVVIVQKVVA